MTIADFAVEERRFMGLPFPQWIYQQFLGVVPDPLGFSVACREELASGGTALICRRIYSNGHREIEKALHPRFQGQPQYERLQAREYTILANLNHPGIVRASRIEVKRTGKKSQTAILIFEDRQAVSLDAFQGFVHELSLRDREIFCVELTSALVEALRFIHGRGIVHGDISPENVIIDPHGFVQLIDFACASREGVEPHGFRVQGKTLYRNPREDDLSEPSSRSDCYAVGKIIETLMGGDLAGSQELAPVVRRLLEDQALPSSLSQNSMRVSILPDRSVFLRQGRLVERTPMTPVRRLITSAPLLRLASLATLGLMLTSWMPQSGRFTFNSWPKTSISIDASNHRASFESPVTNMRLPAGRHRVRIKCPQNSCGSHEREIVILPGDSLKVFEDFYKN